MTMFQNLEIRNFRLFEHLKIERLGRINLIGGRNNSGKTTLLEALFLLSSIAHPESLVRISAFRRLNDPSTSAAAREILLRPLFYKFDSDQAIEISGYHDSLDFMRLKVTVERKNTAIVPLKGRQLDPAGIAPKDPIMTPSSALVDSRENAELNDLRLVYVCGSEEVKSEGHLHIIGDEIHMQTPSNQSPLVATLVSFHTNSSAEDANYLGALRRSKSDKVNLLVKALSRMEPRLQVLEENSVAGYPTIWADIGIKNALVPLSMMGDGINRLIRILLAIFTAAAGSIVMVDEIENGIHYSVLEELWAAIADAAEHAQVQIFVTTHSFECMEAAHKALGDKLIFHRIEEDKEGKSRCVTLDEEAVAAVIHYGFEVR